MNLTLINNRYRIVRSLGKGGFGETFLVEDTQLPSGRYCVLKQLTPVEDNHQIYQLVQERFQREAAILEELGESSGGQIPRLYAYFSEADKFYLVQEYIEGETLTQKLQAQGRLSETSVREILAGILPILDYVHNRRIVHRDIKPDNVILRRLDQKPVLIDFGAVKETMATLINQAPSSRSIVIGTPGFMPGEQAAGRPMYSSDLYSLGLTAIYLLTGKMPQELPTDPLSGGIQWRQYALSITPSFANMLDTAILPNGRDRYQTARQMLDALIGSAPTCPPLPVVSPPVLEPTVVPNFANHYPPDASPNASPGNACSPIASPVPSPSTESLSNQGNLSQMPTFAAQGRSVPAIPASQTPVNQMATLQARSNDWLKAILMGSLIGSFILAGLLIIRPFQSSDSQSVAEPPIATESPSSDRPLSSDQASPLPSESPPEPEPITEPVLEPATEPVIEAIGESEPEEGSEQLPEPDPNPSPENVIEPVAEPIASSSASPVPAQASISEPEAIDLVNAWLQAKRTMFAPPYDTQIAQTITTGLLLEDLTKANGSIGWLRNNDARYQFGVQKIDSVQRLIGSGNQATVEMLVTEDRTLYINGRVDASQTDFKTQLIRYSLERTENTWKIADYKILGDR